MNIVQIGTCVANDYVSEFVKTNSDNVNLLLLVEPMSLHNETILECYKNIKNLHLENIVITDKQNPDISFFYHKSDGPMYEVASVDKNHILKHGYGSEGIVEIKIKCMTLTDLFEKYNLDVIDVLFIDAEGMDDTLIKTLDLKKYNISKIYFEYLHLKSQDVYDFLSNCGYDIIRDSTIVGWSSLATKKK